MSAGTQVKVTSRHPDRTRHDQTGRVVATVHPGKPTELVFVQLDGASGTVPFYVDELAVR